MNHEKDEQSFLWNLKSKIQEHFKNKSLKTHYFKDFSRTTYTSRTIQGIQGIEEPLATLNIFMYCVQGGSLHLGLSDLFHDCWNIFLNASNTSVQAHAQIPYQ